MPFDGIASGHLVALESLARGIRPPQRLSIWQWAEKNIVLPGGTTNRYAQGEYRVARSPGAREIMECLSPHHPAKKVVAMMSSQFMKTQIGLNFLFFYTAHDPQMQLCVWPTETAAEEFSQDKYTRIADASPAVRERLVQAKSRDSGNRILNKTFPGGGVKFAGANSPAGLASRGGAILWCDEVDRYPASAGIEGDPVSIAERALINYQDDAKEYLSSTPTIKSLSRIFKEFQLSDQRYYHVPCPHCDTLQVLKWENFKWDAGKPETAHFVCTEHGCIIREADKETMLPDEHMGGKAKWIAANPGSKVPGFHGWAAYSWLGMGLSWHTLAAKWEECNHDAEKEKVYVNIYRGECFDDPTEKLDWEVIRSRGEAYPLRHVPAGCLILTAGVDVQGSRLAVQIVGWGINGQVWPGIDWIELPGDPTKDEVWQSLRELLTKPIVNGWGISLKITATVIDTNYLTDYVLRFVRANQHLNIFAGHGSKQQGKQAISSAAQQDRNSKGKAKKHGVRDWVIGADGIKHTVFLWLQEDGKTTHAHERRVHFSAELPESYFVGLCSETYDPHKKLWVRTVRLNEPLDTLVYAIAAARHPKVRLHLMKETDWQRFQSVIEPPTGDLFNQPPAAEPPAPAAAPAAAEKIQKPRRVPRRSNFVTGFKR